MITDDYSAKALCPDLKTLPCRVRKLHYKSKLTEDIGLDRRITGEKLVFEDAVC